MANQRMAGSDEFKNQVTDAQRKRYTDHFNKVAQAGFQGREAADASQLIADYEAATKGLDADDAFAALDGGRSFGNDSDMVRYNKRREAKAKANAPNSNLPAGDVQPVQPPQQGQIPPGTKVDNSVDNSFGVGRDINQNVGKKGDTNTTIGDNNTIGAGATIGGDYSVTIGGNSAGNGQQGSGSGNVQGGMNNMQLATAYGSLNNNSYYRSRAQLNGAGRADQASSEASRITGAKDRVANLYNATGIDQNYWRNKANKQTNFYLGDIFKEGFGVYDFTMPHPPRKIEDNTESIYNDAKKEIKDV